MSSVLARSRLAFVRTRREVHLGEHLPPWYYGYAYQDWPRQADIFYPMPFNWIMWLTRWVHWRWTWMRSTESPLDRAFFRQLNKERGKQYTEGLRAGRADMIQLLYRLQFITTPVAMVLSDLEKRQDLHCGDRERVTQALRDQFPTIYPQPDEPPTRDQIIGKT